MIILCDHSLRPLSAIALRLPPRTSVPSAENLCAVRRAPLRRPPRKSSHLQTKSAAFRIFNGLTIRNPALLFLSVLTRRRDHSLLCRKYRCDIPGIMTKAPCGASLIRERHVCIEICISLCTLLSFTARFIAQIRFLVNRFLPEQLRGRPKIFLSHRTRSKSRFSLKKSIVEASDGFSFHSIFCVCSKILVFFSFLLF